MLEGDVICRLVRRFGHSEGDIRRVAVQAFGALTVFGN